MILQVAKEQLVEALDNTGHRSTGGLGLGIDMYIYIYISGRLEWGCGSDQQNVVP